MPTVGIRPDIPHEKTVDNLAVVLQEGLEVEDFTVVERSHHADTLQNGRIALVVFDGIDDGMQHVWRRTYLMAHRGGTLLKVIVVGIDAGYHLRSQAIGKRHLLAAAERIAAGKQDFEMQTTPSRLIDLVLHLAQKLVPEENVIVTLHIGYNAQCRPTALKTVGGGNICRIEMGCQTGHGFSDS